MTSFRLLRVNELLKRVIAEYLHKHFRKESLSITITKVEASPDLKHANVYYSVYNEESKKPAIQFLNRIKHVLYSVVGKEARLKYSPVLSFVWDETLEKGHRVLDILHQLDEEDEGHKELRE